MQVNNVIIIAAIIVLSINIIYNIIEGATVLPRIFLNISNISLVLILAKHLYNKKRDAIFNIISNGLSERGREESLYYLINNLPSPITIIGQDFKLLSMNQNVIKLTGVEEKKVIGKKCYDVFGNGSICSNCPVKAAFSSKKIEKNLKQELTRKDAEIFIEQTAIPILTDDGKVKNVLEIIFDVTDKVKLEKENSQLFIKTVSAFCKLIEKRDTYTGMHSINVQKISLQIGNQLNLSPNEIEELSIAAVLHDIGKIGIPEQILTKPCKLTQEEYEKVKAHAKIGCETIKDIPRLKNIAKYILHHHERFDGKGYPEGLKGKEIPLLSRIISVADVYDALTSNRVYRRKSTIKEALDIIKAEKGLQLDPQLVDIFISIIHKDSNKCELKDVIK